MAIKRILNRMGGLDCIFWLRIREIGQPLKGKFV
jgi:hypothetical protein